MKVVCIRHPKYNGKDAPVLSCKTCCNMFVKELREENQRARIARHDGGEQSVQEWLEEKKRENRHDTI